MGLACTWPPRVEWHLALLNGSGFLRPAGAHPSSIPVLGWTILHKMARLCNERSITLTKGPASPPSACSHSSLSFTLAAFATIRINDTLHPDRGDKIVSLEKDHINILIQHRTVVVQTSVGTNGFP